MKIIYFLFFKNMLATISYQFHDMPSHPCMEVNHLPFIFQSTLNQYNFVGDYLFTLNLAGAWFELGILCFVIA